MRADRLATQANRVYTGAVRPIWKRIRYRLEWLALKGAAKIVPLLSHKACYRLAQVTGTMAAIVDRAGRRVALSNLEIAFGDELSSDRRARIVNWFLGRRRYYRRHSLWLRPMFVSVKVGIPHQVPLVARTTYAPANRRRKHTLGLPPGCWADHSTRRVGSRRTGDRSIWLYICSG